MEKYKKGQIKPITLKYQFQYDQVLYRIFKINLCILSKNMKH